MAWSQHLLLPYIHFTVNMLVSLQCIRLYLLYLYINHGERAYVNAFVLYLFYFHQLLALLLHCKKVLDSNPVPSWGLACSLCVGFHPPAQRLASQANWKIPNSAEVKLKKMITLIKKKRSDHDPHIGGFSYCRYCICSCSNQ